MIPVFPNFKKIELSDRTEIERSTKEFAPYSDFSFTSLWSWDTARNIGLSKLNHNLVVRFCDYQTHELFYSFLGNADVSETARTLLHFSKKEGIEPTLRLVPHDSVLDLDKSFSVSEDRDHFDYIYDLFKLHECKGNALELHRRAAKKFVRSTTGITTKEINVTESYVQKNMLGVMENWRLNKIAAGKDVHAGHELEALKRFFLSSHNVSGMVAVGIFDNSHMIGFAINEVLFYGIAINHFIKADTKYQGIFSYLMQENANILISHHRSHLNFEQDLGLPGLRQSKSTFRPVYFLKKYVIKLMAVD